MSLPDTPAPPRFLLANSEHTILIDTEGGLCLLHPQRLNALDPIRFPFPGTITNAVLLNDHHLVSTWVEREISLARLAVLDLREPLQDGIDLPVLRMAIEGGRIDRHHVAGAVWSHVLDAEPLALCTFETDLIFCTHHRGIYRITPTSDEVWRRSPVEWDSLEHFFSSFNAILRWFNSFTSLIFIHLSHKKEIFKFLLTPFGIAATCLTRGYHFEFFKHQQPNHNAAPRQLYVLLLYVYPADDGEIATIRCEFVVGIFLN